MATRNIPGEMKRDKSLLGGYCREKMDEYGIWQTPKWIVSTILSSPTNSPTKNSVRFEK